MPTFVYKAKNLKGELLEGAYETSAYETLEYMLRERGYFLVESKKKGVDFTFTGFIGRVTSKDIALFCRQFAVIVNAGITIVETIAILRDQTEKKKLKDILDIVHEELQKGKVLSEAMGMYPETFPDFMLSMIRVGEASGSLDSIMNRLADYYENDSRIKRKVSTAMTYPSILAVLTVGVVILLMVKVLPMFSDILSTMGGQMPLLTKILMTISGFLARNIVLVILVLIFLISAVWYYLKTDTGTYWFDGLKLRIPLIRNATIKVITSRFARSMGILLKSGIPIINSMDIMGNLIGNRVIEDKFKACRDEIKEGHGIANPVKRLGIFPPLLVHMIAVGESTGELDEMLTRTAGFFDEEVEESIARLTTLIEPVMIIIMAAVVGTIILSVMLPMINIMSTVQ